MSSSHGVCDGIAALLVAIQGKINGGKRPVIVMVSGGSGSGKTSVVVKGVIDHFSDRATALSADSYYRDLGRGLTAVEVEKINTDSPDALDLELLKQHLETLRNGLGIDVPQYDYKTCTRTPDTSFCTLNDVIVVDGMFVLRDEFAAVSDVCVFVEAREDVRLQRKITRDAGRTGRTVESIETYFREIIVPMHEQYVEPTKRNADIIIVNN